MIESRTLRCPRHLGMILAGAAIVALFGVVAVDKARGGAGLPAYAAGAVCSLLALGALPMLRTRMILRGDALTLVWGYGRHRLAWTDIVEISADAHHGFWLLHVRTEDHERVAAFFPVRLASIPVDQGTHLREPSGDAPYGLYRLHAELWEEWRRHVPAPRGRAEARPMERSPAGPSWCHDDQHAPPR
ncbi:PH domain-containing protein [Actinomadura madurae]|uniref:PH domain-containing protein n=1 Tax=Actinomadura madurae TaxID=1993 RepID=UPI0020D1F70E|nr:PH domain-containing protein [Actinomadura madurae]MCQ0008519.1 PH domain-containing protein [Actinomadura madurae]